MIKRPNNATMAAGLAAAAMFLSILQTSAASAQVVPVPPSPGMEDRGGKFSGLTSKGFDPARDTEFSLDRYDQLLTYSRCAASVSGPALARALQAPPMTSGEGQVLVLFDRMNACGSTGGTRILSLVRGSLAEAVYRVRGGDLPRRVAAGSAELKSFLDGETAWGSKRAANDQSMARATACLAATQPAVVTRIFAAEHGSSLESSLMDALFRASPDCAGSSRPSNLSRSFLRAFLAEGLYRFALYRAGSAAAAK